MRVIHLSSNRRIDGCAGGVEKFAWYLSRAIGCEIVTDFNERLDPGRDLVIADFHHTMRVPSDITTICMLHGCIKEMALRVDKLGDFMGVIQQQQEACHRPKTIYVASSLPVRDQVSRHHGLSPDQVVVIPHGVDSAWFYLHVPFADPPYVVLDAAADYVKNSHRVHETSLIAAAWWPGRFAFEYLNARIGEEANAFARGHFYIHPSHYEGDSYAVLEALMANLPIVVSTCGRFDQFDPGVYRFGHVMARTASPEDYAQALQTISQNYAWYAPRAYALAHADYETFAESWRRLVFRVARDRRLD